MTAQEEKVPVRLVEHGHLPVDYLVRVGDYQAFLRLPENLVEPHDGQDAAVDKVAEYVAGADGRKLVGVADEHQAAAHGQRAHYAFEDVAVHHRHFVDDKRVAFQLVFLVFVEYGVVLLVPAHLKQTVDGFCLVARKLAHALGGASRRGGKQHLFAPALQYFYYRVKRGGFACAGAAGEHQHALAERGCYRVALKVGVSYAVAFFKLRYRVFKVLFAFGGEGEHHFHARGYVHFVEVELRREDKVGIAQPVQNKAAVEDQFVKTFARSGLAYAEEARGGVEQFVGGQAGVAVALVVA